MFSEYDKVRYKPTGETCFIVIVDEGDAGTVYGLESEDQERDDWFKWCEESDIELCAEAGA
ncbi:MAG: hypothetical protein IJH04_05705 [Eggerthellaceae bacterium]|nr:hypothetical protein [Eggerthellaceae bacterium]